MHSISIFISRWMLYLLYYLSRWIVSYIGIFLISGTFVVLRTVRFPITQTHPAKVMLTIRAGQMIATSVLLNINVTFGTILRMGAYIISLGWKKWVKLSFKLQIKINCFYLFLNHLHTLWAISWWFGNLSEHDNLIRNESKMSYCKIYKWPFSAANRGF